MHRLACTFAFITLAAAPALAQTAKPFVSTPVPCNTKGFSNCRVSYDGFTVIRTYMHTRGGHTTSVHTGCTPNGAKIFCGPGRWSTDKGYSGESESFVINLDGTGKAKSTTH